MFFVMDKCTFVSVNIRELRDRVKRRAVLSYLEGLYLINNEYFC
jgi:hypothetical protein